MSSTAIAVALHISKTGMFNPFSSSPAVGTALNVHQFQLKFFPLYSSSCQQISFNCNSSRDTSLQLLNAMSFMVLSLTEGGTNNDTPPLFGGQAAATPPSAHTALRMLSRSWPPLLDTKFFMHMTVISLLQETAGKSRWALSKYKLILTFAGIMYSLEPLHLWRQ